MQKDLYYNSIQKVIYKVFFLFRHILAVIHFNHNLQRDVQTRDNTDLMKVTYPKFKNGEATVRHRRVKQSFSKLMLKICEYKS